MYALREDMAFPSSVVGPVAFNHGFVRKIVSACFARRSGVHADLVPILLTLLFSSFLPLS